MYCDRCGMQLQPGQNFCSGCGKVAGNVPMMPVQSRIAGHTRLLAILWLAISAFRLIPGFILLTGSSFLPVDVPFFVPGIVHGIGVLFLASAAIGLFAGWGLLERQPWARMLAIVLAFFSLPDMPFGTALGIYTLWVLLPAKSEEEYRQISSAA